MLSTMGFTQFITTLLKFIYKNIEKARLGLAFLENQI